MPPRWMWRGALMAACLLTVAPSWTGRAALGAESPADAPIPGTVIERTVSEMVLIEVYVTDREGRPLRGLTVDDFVLKIDQHREPKTIASLEYFEAAPPVAPAETRPAEREPEAAEPPLQRDKARRFVLFFDDATSAPAGLTAARRAAEDFIDARLRPGDQVSLAAYDYRRKLRVLHDFTTDREALRAALRESVEDRGRISDFSTERDRRREEVARPLRQAYYGNDNFYASEDARFKALHYAREDVLRMGSVIRAVRSLVEALAPWPGYKAIVFMGDGIPENPGQDYYLLDGTQSLALDLTGLAYAAGSAGVTLHTVETSGIEAGDADEMAAASRRSNALATLAMNTGGMARSTNDLMEALADVEASSHAFYLLGYEPEGPPDGEYHTVNLKVKVRGAHLRYRRGFTRLLPEKAREQVVQAAHLVPELYPDLGLQVAAVSGPADGDGRIADLVVYVPAGRLLFLPGDGGPTARIEIGLVALEDSGKETFRVARRVRVAIAPDLVATWRSLGLNFFTRVRLPVSSQSVTAVVSDLQSGAIGATRYPVAGRKRTHGDVLGLSVYSMSERSLWIELDAEKPAEHGAETAVKYRVGPALRSRFISGEPMTCGFRVPATGATGLQVEITQGDAVVRVAEIEPRSGEGHATITVPLPVEGIPDGEYELRVRQTGPAGVSERGRYPFAIEAPAVATAD